MGKGARHREVRRSEREHRERDARERAATKKARAEFFAAFDEQDDDAGPALPCPACNAFERRWASEEEAAPAIRAFEVEHGLATSEEGDSRTRVAICLACGEASVVPDL